MPPWTIENYAPLDHRKLCPPWTIETYAPLLDHRKPMPPWTIETYAPSWTIETYAPILVIGLFRDKGQPLSNEWGGEARGNINNIEANIIP